MASLQLGNGVFVCLPVCTYQCVCAYLQCVRISVCATQCCFALSDRFARRAARMNQHWRLLRLVAI